MPEGGRERNQGYQLRLATAPVLLIDFSLLTLSYAKLEETGKEKEVEEEEKEEKEHGGGVKLTEYASPQPCCCALFWTFTKMERRRDVLLDFLYSYERRRLHLSILFRGRKFH